MTGPILSIGRFAGAKKISVTHCADRRKNRLQYFMCIQGRPSIELASTAPHSFFEKRIAEPKAGEIADVALACRIPEFSQRPCDAVARYAQF